MCNAQTLTKVSGKVFDAVTKEAMPFASVTFKGISKGASTDINGNFVVQTPLPVDSITVSYLGYEKKTLGIKRGVTQVLNVGLNAAGVTLNEITVVAGPSKALVLFDKIIDNRKHNNKDKLDAYQCETYNKIEFDFNNITDKLKQSNLLKAFDFAFENIDSTNKEEKPHLPVFISEALSDFYFSRKPDYKKEIIKATKVAGVKNAGISQAMGSMAIEINIYHNTIVILDKQFISPIAGTGKLFYKYSLVDSAFIDNHWCYQIDFKPKHKQTLTFTGNFWVADSSFAIKRIQMAIADDANINYVNSLRYYEDFDEVDTSWLPSREKMIIDFNLQEKTMGVYARKTTYYKDYMLNQPKELSFFDPGNVVVKTDAAEKSNEFWNESRHDTLTKNENEIYKLVDTITTLPRFKAYANLVSFLTYGYLKYGLVEIGPAFSFYNTNETEGNRLKFGMRTSTKFAKDFELSGYGAYGFLDKEWKYNAGFRWMFNPKQEQEIGATFSRDFQLLGVDADDAFDQSFLSAIRTTSLIRLTDIHNFNFYYERQFTKDLLCRFSAVHQKLFAIGDYVYQNPDSTLGENSPLTTSEFGFYAHYAYHDNYIKTGTFSRMTFGKGFNPVFELRYNQGLKGISGSMFSYSKLAFEYHDKWRINPFGYFSYDFEIGKVLGHIPYPLLYVHPGNQTFAYDYSGFNMMNFFEFVSDQYFMAAAAHHFEGYFVNRIPMMRKLKWREIVEAKGVIGTVSAANKSILLFPAGLDELRSKPYLEAGFGFENMFKILRVEALYRMSYLNKPGVHNFGVKFAIQVGF